MSIVPILVANQAATTEASARAKALAPFMDAGAFGPGEAIDWRPSGKTAEQLVRAGVIKELRPGRYWHDRTAQASAHQAARKILTLVAGVLMLVGLVLIVSL